MLASRGSEQVQANFGTAGQKDVGVKAKGAACHFLKRRNAEGVAAANVG
jgi:hypothetical protein